jgi:hypothetical protein
MIIGLSGYAQSGKDTVANYLVERHGFCQIAFADALKEALYALNPLVGDDVYLREVVTPDDWQTYKHTEWYEEIRRLLQVFGTEVARDLWDKDFWVKVTIEKAKECYNMERVVFSDCRFINEMEAICDHGGMLWRINRPGTLPPNDHPSETEALTFEKYDEYLVNDGTIEDLKKKVDNLILLHSV